MYRASSQTYAHPSFTVSCSARSPTHPSSSRDLSSPRHWTPIASADPGAFSGSAGIVTRRSSPPAHGQMRRVSLTPPPLARNAEDLTRDPALRIDETHASTSRLGDRSRGDYQTEPAYRAEGARQRHSADEAASSWARGEGQSSSSGRSSGNNDDQSSRRRPDLKLALGSTGGAGPGDGSDRSQDRLPGIAQLDEYLASPWPKPAVPASTPSRFQGSGGDTFRRTRESLPPLGLPGFASSSSSSAPHSSTWDSASRPHQTASLPSPSGSLASSHHGYDQMERRPSLTQIGRRTSAVMLDRQAPDGRPYALGSLLSPRPAEALAHSHGMTRSNSQLENREAMRSFSEQHGSQKRKASFDASPILPSSAAVQASMRPHASGLPPQPFVAHQGRDYANEARSHPQGDRWHDDSIKRRREHDRWSPERQPASGLPAAREGLEEHLRYTGGPSYSATAASHAASSHDRRHYEEQRHAYDWEQSQAGRHHLAASTSHPPYMRGDDGDRGYPSGHGLPTSRSYDAPSNRHEHYRNEHSGQYGRYPGGPDDRERDAGSSGAPGVRKRGKLPKAVTDLLKSWLLEHATHPYPTDEEKRRLCASTGLTMSQVSNWFINARRRILVPSPSGGFAVGGSAAAEQVREMFQADPHHHSSRSRDPRDARHARPPSPPRYAYQHEPHERYGRR